MGYSFTYLIIFLLFHHYLVDIAMQSTTVWFSHYLFSFDEYSCILYSMQSNKNDHSLCLYCLTHSRSRIVGNISINFGYTIHVQRSADSSAKYARVLKGKNIRHSRRLQPFFVIFFDSTSNIRIKMQEVRI